MLGIRASTLSKGSIPPTESPTPFQVLHDSRYFRHAGNQAVRCQADEWGEVFESTDPA